jgi:hypothetical protein
MTPPSMESIFLILSGVILAAGVLYWMWSHLQLTQKKVQLLENAVFELRGMLTSRGAGPPSPAPAPSPAPSPSPVPAAAAYNDLPEDDDWDSAEEAPVAPVIREDDTEDLAPGGRIVGFAEVETVEEKSAEEFRELFIAESGSAQAAAAPSTPQSLESMPVKELRRLAEQRGIKGVAELRKKELLAALRQQVVPTVVEKTLDLTVEAEAAEVEAVALD